MATSFVIVDRDTPMLFSPDLREWVSEAFLQVLQPARALRILKVGAGMLEWTPSDAYIAVVPGSANVLSGRAEPCERRTGKPIPI